MHCATSCNNEMTRSDNELLKINAIVLVRCHNHRYVEIF